jgi:hypothetical protein
MDIMMSAAGHLGDAVVGGVTFGVLEQEAL